MNFDHTLFIKADDTAFSRVKDYLSRMKTISKKKELVDVDGSFCAIYTFNDTEFSVNNDYYVDSLYVSSTNKLSEDFLQKLGKVANDSNYIGEEKRKITAAEIVKVLEKEKKKSSNIRRVPTRVARNPRTGEVVKVISKVSKVSKAAQAAKAACTIKPKIVDEKKKLSRSSK